MSIKNKKYHVGDLVTRAYDYRIDSIPDKPENLPLGIVLENTPSRAMSVMVYWLVDSEEWKDTRRLSSVKLLRLVNRA